jgi:glycosyltransferase involved in cell wall biosynthesis
MYSPVPGREQSLCGRNIFFLISALGAGGAERVIALLAAHWIKAGAHVTILSFDGEGDGIYHDFAPDVQLRRLNIPASRPLRRIREVRRLLRRHHPDIVISFLTKINILTLAAAIGLNRPVIISERNNPLRQTMHPLWSAAKHLLYRHADAIVCQTSASMSAIPRGARSRISVIGNPVAHFPWRPASAGGASRLVAVGRLTEQKGFDILIEAFARIAMRHPEWSLEIWGEGPNRAALEALIDTLGLADRIRLPGLSAMPGKWIERASAFVLSSRYEGFPNVLAEAMAAGLPVVATDCAFGPAELISSEVDGLLVASEDAVCLAGALDRMLGDPLLRDRTGTRARQVVERFGADKIARQWDTLLERALWPSSGGGAARRMILPDLPIPENAR